MLGVSDSVAQLFLCNAGNTFTLFKRVCLMIVIVLLLPDLTILCVCYLWVEIVVYMYIWVSYREDSFLFCKSNSPIQEHNLYIFHSFSSISRIHCVSFLVYFYYEFQNFIQCEGQMDNIGNVSRMRTISTLF